MTNDEIIRKFTQMESRNLRYIYTIACARELPRHRPLRCAAATAYDELTAIFGDTATVRRAVDLLNRTARSKHEEMSNIGAHHEAWLGVVISRAEQLNRTPLKAELPWEPVMRLWFYFGKWSTVLRAAKLSTLTGEKLAQAAKQYALRAATPLNLPDEMCNEFDALLMLDLYDMCALARELKRTPVLEEFSKDARKRFKKTGFIWRDVAKDMGLPAQSQHRS